ncbi:MAG: hypothetical protein ABI378_09810 [Chitinophagaceae bacterium]
MHKISLFLVMLVVSFSSQAQSVDVPIFFKQLKTLMEASHNDHYASIRGALISTTAAGRKVYECTKLLTGFDVVLIELSKGGMLLNAQSAPEKGTGKAVAALLNNAQRVANGIDLGTERDELKTHPEKATDYDTYINLAPATWEPTKVVVMVEKAEKSFTLLVP